MITGSHVIIYSKKPAADRDKMAAEGINCSEVSDEGWGLLCRISLPGGGKLGVYEPRHARP